MEHELELVRERYPDARHVGIADGAHDGWNWLQQHTSWQILDFWHASEYINSVAADILLDEHAQLAPTRSGFTGDSFSLSR